MYLAWGAFCLYLYPCPSHGESIYLSSLEMQVSLLLGQR